MKTCNTQQLHVSEQPWSWHNWAQKINWDIGPFVVLTPLISCYGILFVPMQRETIIFAFLYYLLTGMAITAGYHRLWSHRAYSASLPVRIVFALLGAGALQKSIEWWCRDHRAHHRYTDTRKDPYSAHKGLLYSHIGWLLFTKNPKDEGYADVSDLRADWVVRIQHDYYWPISVFMGLVMPCAVSGYFWGDYQGGFFFVSIARTVVVHHVTFCVNSVAHWLGDQPFDDKHTPKNHFLTALLTFGEGYHNFHHQFPNDYRNAIRFYQYDPTKWCISALKYLGLVSHLQTFPENEIQKGILQMEKKKIDMRLATLNWGTPIEDLPVMEYHEYQTEAKSRTLVLISGVVHDVSPFVDTHPGGKNLITSGVGKDMTAAFFGGVYSHSNAAQNLLASMRVAVVRGGMDVKIWNGGDLNAPDKGDSDQDSIAPEGCN